VRAQGTWRASVRVGARTLLALGDAVAVEEVDAVVLGAGPAGLAAAAALVGRSRLDVRLVEYGSPIGERNRLAPEDVTSGIGGAGLFSDGKFSFFPSATNLWRLSPRRALAASYDWYQRLLRDLPWAELVPKLPGTEAAAGPRPVGGEVMEKSYPSYYTTLAEREALTSALASSLGRDVILTNTDIDEMDVGARGATVVTRDRASGLVTELASRALVIATGRLSPLELVRMVPGAQWRDGRLEVGVRLEQPAERFMLASHPSVDPKLVATQADGVAVRTFCCCRNGEVIATYTRGIVSVSGRADVSPTGRSNVGIVLRPSASMRRDDPSLLDRVTDVGQHFICDAGDFLGHSPSRDLVAVLGEPITTRLGHAIRQIAEVVGCELLPDEATVHGIAVEGVGNYPDLRDDLRWGDFPVWVAGDATGLFRGLTAAFVSGFFAGNRARVHLLAASE